MNKFKVLPQIVPFDFGADQINLDEMVSATCTVNKGDLPLDISWIHADTSGIERGLVTNDGVVITRTNQRISMLSIEAVKARHRGNYSCFAKNKAGNSQHSAALHINGESKRNYFPETFEEFCNLLQKFQNFPFKFNFSSSTNRSF